MVAKPSVFEKATSSLGTTLAAAATPAALLALSSESPGVLVVAAAAMIPPLVASLPAQRQKQRVAQWQKDVTADLELLKAQIQQLTDEQYQLINEVVSAEKLSYLRAAVRNTISMKDVASQDAVLLGRVMRDISAEEVVFLEKNDSFEKVCTGNFEQTDITLVIRPNSRENLLVLGLERLGILEHDNFVFDGGQVLKFSKIAAKLLELLRS